MVSPPPQSATSKQPLSTYLSELNADKLLPNEGTPLKETKRSYGSKSDNEEQDQFLPALRSSYRRRVLQEKLWEDRSCVERMATCCDDLSWQCIRSRFEKKIEYKSRTITLGGRSYDGPFPANVVRNQKYSIISFIPLVLLEQFMFFANLYFLLTTLSQAIPVFKIGIAFSYYAPLFLVLGITMCREAYDDINRYLKDKQLNEKKYTKLIVDGTARIKSEEITVGDLLLLKKDERVPADCVLMRTSDRQGCCYIRTDQLDGETDWKMKLALANTQHLATDNELFNINAHIFVDKPHQDIHSFLGTYTGYDTDGKEQQIPLDIENALWGDTVLAAGTAVVMVIYTGRETRAVMNKALPESKFGRLDWECNNYMKALFAMVFVVSIIMTFVSIGFNWMTIIYFVRYIILFSNIIPISLRVNLDIAKLCYAWFVWYDKKLPGVFVRNSTVSEELGRISYLLSDKTGTLTKNEMVFRKLHLGTLAYAHDSFNDIKQQMKLDPDAQETFDKPNRVGGNLTSKLRQSVLALALCHNVSPVAEDSTGSTAKSETATAVTDDTDPTTLSTTDGSVVSGTTTSDVDKHKPTVNYQGASPDEMALVGWCDSVGVTLVRRDLHSMTLQFNSTRTAQILLEPQHVFVDYDVLHVFPFTSDTKRMGIVVRDQRTGQIVFYVKGADTVIRDMVVYNDWLDEECSNMAREGLRTLCVAQRILTQVAYNDFAEKYSRAKLVMSDRHEQMLQVQQALETDMQLLCITGVEDSLQDDVRSSLELFSGASIKVWMLTGDKMETAVCIAKSSGLFRRTDDIFMFNEAEQRLEALDQLEKWRRLFADLFDDKISNRYVLKQANALVITGNSLRVCIEFYEKELAELVSECRAVVCCRCSPDQKKQLVKLLQKYSGSKRIAAVGDGGNDVAMIQAAHAGIGIEAKEGKQASLAADFSIKHFSQLCRLILVHGRNSYRRSTELSLFIIHRGLIISVIQAIFSTIFYFSSVAIYQGTLMLGYSTVYTSLPIFVLILDRDVKSSVALTYPELYKDISKGRLLGMKAFFIWFLISCYQGAVIMYSVIVLDMPLANIVSISFTSLILVEMITVGLAVHYWRWEMVVSELFSILSYAATVFIPFFGVTEIFDMTYLTSWPFLWRCVLSVGVSCVPLYILKCIRMTVTPPTYVKVR